jgi:hypothetical protein
MTLLLARNANGPVVVEPHAGIAAGEILLREDFSGSALNGTLWQDTYPYGDLNGVSTSASNVAVGDGLCTLTLSSSSVGACILTQPAGSVTGFEYGYGIVEWLAYGPTTDWWSLWQTAGPTGLYPEYDVVEMGYNTPGTNYHFWNGSTDEYTWNSDEFSTDFIGGWHYYTLRRNADDTFDAWYDTTQVVVAETATDDSGINNFLVANIGVGNGNTTSVGETVQIDHVYAWALP